MMLFFNSKDLFECYRLFNVFLILIIMISVHKHSIVSEFNSLRVILEIRSAHLYPESGLLLVTRQMALQGPVMWEVSP